MGGYTEARDFMMLLFAGLGCFCSALPSGAVFDVVMIDLMQWLAGLVNSKKLHQNGFNTNAITSRLEEAVALYQNTENDPRRPIVQSALVVLLDTVHQVPKSKGATQKERDSGVLPHINETRYNALRAMNPSAAANSRFIENNHQPFAYPLQGSEVWRSDLTKLQLYMEITCHLLHTPVPPDRVLIIDDGLALSTEEYERVHREVVTASHFQARSAFEQDCLVHNHLTGLLTRYLVWGDGQCREWPSTGSGEADIKVQHYINRSNGAHRFLVVNQDTDLIFILLLHMHRLVEGEWADSPVPLELWLDTESPNNRSGVNKPYRYINIVRLYAEIKALFAREFPSVVHPIETFCFLFFTQRSDFVAPFCDDCPNKQGHDNCMCIRDADTWNLFSELHSDPARSFILFSHKQGGAVKRSSERYWSNQLHGLLNHAVSYDAVQGHFLFMHHTLRKFYYLMFQRKVMAVRHTLRLPVPLSESCDFFGPIRADAIDCRELCVYAHDVAERIEAYRRHLAAEEAVHLLALQAVAAKKRVTEDVLEQGAAKKFKASSRLAIGGGGGKTHVPLDTADSEEESEWSGSVKKDFMNFPVFCAMAQELEESLSNRRADGEEGTCSADGQPWSRTRPGAHCADDAPRVAMAAGQNPEGECTREEVPYIFPRAPSDVGDRPRGGAKVGEVAEGSASRSVEVASGTRPAAHFADGAPTVPYIFPQVPSEVGDRPRHGAKVGEVADRPATLSRTAAPFADDASRVPYIFAHSPSEVGDAPRHEAKVGEVGDRPRRGPKVAGVAEGSATLSRLDVQCADHAPTLPYIFPHVPSECAFAPRHGAKVGEAGGWPASSSVEVADGPRSGTQCADDAPRVAMAADQNPEGECTHPHFPYILSRVPSEVADHPRHGAKVGEVAEGSASRSVVVASRPDTQCVDDAPTVPYIFPLTPSECADRPRQRANFGLDAEGSASRSVVVAEGPTPGTHCADHAPRVPYIFPLSPSEVADAPRHEAKVGEADGWPESRSVAVASRPDAQGADDAPTDPYIFPLSPSESADRPSHRPKVGEAADRPTTLTRPDAHRADDAPRVAMAAGQNPEGECTHEEAPYIFARGPSECVDRPRQRANFGQDAEGSATRSVVVAEGPRSGTHCADHAPTSPYIFPRAPSEGVGRPRLGAKVGAADEGSASRSRPEADGRGRSAQPPKLLRPRTGSEFTHVPVKKVKLTSRESNTTEAPLAQYVKKNADVLKEFSKFPFKRYHGVLSPEAMLLRLYDIELYMNYCRDGWRMGSWAAQMLTERSHLDDTLSVWPYAERLITDPVERARMLNSSYCVKRYNPQSEHFYDLIEITKTDRVVHTRYGHVQ